MAAATTEDGPQRQAILRQLAVTSAEGGQHGLSREAVFELQASETQDADTWTAFANVALARGNYTNADQSARTALEIDESHPGAWIALAGSYCGLGWFEAADECLGHVDRDQLSDRDRRRLGKAVNRWAMADTRWIVVGLVAALLVGVLAIAVAVSLPLVARQWRLQRLRDAAAESPTRYFETLAAEAWRFERRLRAAHSAAVLTSVVAFGVAVVVL